MKRTIVGIAALALATISAPLAAEAAPHGAGCTLAGKAVFSPGLKAAPANVGFTFKGTLSDCEGIAAKASSATVTSSGKGNVGCTVGSAAGVATIEWNTGKATTVRYNTTDAGAGVLLNGTVTKSTQGGVAKGDDVIGVLAFNADPAQCQSPSGVRKATFDGQVAAGGE